MNITRVLRVIHRDLGFLVVGITLVYGISGILLNHIKSKDPAFNIESRSIQLQTNLNIDELTVVCKADGSLPPFTRIMKAGENNYRLFFEGGIGIYNSTNGILDYEIHTKRVLIYWINRLHYNKVKGWWPVADIFAGSLILLAITGLFIVKGKRGLAGSGKWYLIVGILIPILFGLLFLK